MSDATSRLNKSGKLKFNEVEIKAEHRKAAFLPVGESFKDISDLL